MCGACARGPVVAPWEVFHHGATARDHRLRAAEAQDLTGGRLKVTPFGPTGYVVAARTGGRWVVEDVDHLAGVLVARGGSGVTTRAAAADRGRTRTPVAATVAALGS